MCGPKVKFFFNLVLKKSDHQWYYLDIISFAGQFILGLYSILTNEPVCLNVNLLISKVAGQKLFHLTNDQSMSSMHLVCVSDSVKVIILTNNNNNNNIKKNNKQRSIGLKHQNLEAIQITLLQQIVSVHTTDTYSCSYTVPLFLLSFNRVSLLSLD